MAQELPPKAGAARPAEESPVAWSARLRNAGRTVRGTLAGLGSVLRLSWRVSPLLTAGLGVVTVVIGLVPALATYLTSVLINAVAAALPGGAAEADTGRIWLLVGLQFLVFSANALASAVYGIVGRLLEERVGLLVQQRIMAKAAELDLAFFEDSASYDLLREAQQEASSRPASMVSGAFGQLQVAITFVSMVALLVGLSPLLALVAMLAPVPAFLADSRFGRRMFRFARWSSPLRRRMQYLTSLVTADTAAKEVKLFGLGGFLVGRFEELGRTLYRRQRQLVVARNLSYAGWGLITTVVTSLTYLYVALEAIRGRLTIGDIVLFSSALTAAQAAVQSLFRGFTTMYEDNLYLQRLRDLLAVPTAMTASPGVPLPEPVRGHVVFEHVSFRYPGADALALDDVSMEIPPGRTLAVVGRNGAGKSTVVKLLCRLYDPLSGRILLDGVDIRELDVAELRSAVGAMFQDYVAYQATAAENIGYGDLSRLDDRAAVVECARRGGAAEVIEKLPDGYDSQLGKWFEQGAELSGGEWQKVALSRAFMRDARILVLDEPTAALDAQAEFELFERLRRLAAGRTTVYISHRFSTVRKADRVLLLRAGRVAEQGTHDELMALDGEYARLFAMQAFAYLDLPEPGTDSTAEPVGEKGGA